MSLEIVNNDSNCQHGRLIDADALMEKIYDSTYPLYSRQFEGYVIPMSRLEEIINNAPTVSAIPHGEWLQSPIKSDMWHCSSCGSPLITDDIEETHFCPNCGADMRGGDTE